MEGRASVRSPSPSGGQLKESFSVIGIVADEIRESTPVALERTLDIVAGWLCWLSQDRPGVSRAGSALDRIKTRGESHVLAGRFGRGGQGADPSCYGVTGSPSMSSSAGRLGSPRPRHTILPSSPIPTVLSWQKYSTASGERSTYCQGGREIEFAPT